MLAYTNRFLAIAAITRNLHERYRAEGSPSVKRQIDNLRRRLVLIRRMQATGIMSLIACILAVVFLFLKIRLLGEALFGLALVFMLASLLLCFREINLSGRALEIQLEDLENHENAE